ncbi:MAG: HAD-IA family hydrolase [Clostridia bacterium]|nr:HAD-IA family hydrolase [Clostridia bacterium]
MKIENVIFDLDGTLLNTLDDLRDSVNHVLSEHGMPQRTLREIRSFVGNGIPKLIRRSVPEGTDEETCRICLDEMLVFYAAHCDIKTAAYDGINALLRKLREAGIGAAVVTNKAQNAAQLLCEEKFHGLVGVVIGGDPGRRYKPAPDGVFDAMKTLGAAPETTVYVGDSDVDMQTAANAGLPAVGVLWGFRDREDLEPYHPLALAATPEELERILI